MTDINLMHIGALCFIWTNNHTKLYVARSFDIQIPAYADQTTGKFEIQDIAYMSTCVLNLEIYGIKH